MEAVVGTPLPTYCVCRSVYEDGRFSVCCDVCDEWYHADCLGIPADDRQRLEEPNSTWECPKCVAASKEPPTTTGGGPGTGLKRRELKQSVLSFGPECKDSKKVDVKGGGLVKRLVSRTVSVVSRKVVVDRVSKGKEKDKKNAQHKDKVKKKESTMVKGSKEKGKVMAMFQRVTTETTIPPAATDQTTPPPPPPPPSQALTTVQVVNTSDSPSTPVSNPPPSTMEEDRPCGPPTNTNGAETPVREGTTHEIRSSILTQLIKGQQHPEEDKEETLEMPPCERTDTPQPKLDGDRDMEPSTPSNSLPHIPAPTAPDTKRTMQKRRRDGTTDGDAKRRKRNVEPPEKHEDGSTSLGQYRRTQTAGRDQSAETPDWLLRYVRAAFGEFFDPCPPPFTSGSGGERRRFDGLQVAWSPRLNYVNPPFREASDWLKKATEELQLRPTARHVFLLPCAKLHTKSFAHLFHAVTSVDVFSHPIAFKGYATPLPCAMMLLHLTAQGTSPATSKLGGQPAAATKPSHDTPPPPPTPPTVLRLLRVPAPSIFQQVQDMTTRAGYPSFVFAKHFSRDLPEVLRSHQAMALLCPSRMDSRLLQSSVLPRTCGVFPCVGTLRPDGESDPMWSGSVLLILDNPTSDNFRRFLRHPWLSLHSVPMKIINVPFLMARHQSLGEEVPQEWPDELDGPEGDAVSCSDQSHCTGGTEEQEAGSNPSVEL